ncbi:hypothetical protein ETAA8_15510 [Anatilimnocola aggregata]|uniref:Lipoprotein n=1 Tax=Anatilimnocola aggregata TaxID=2528021 RepID=A0A517Y8C3_9BACT|nr:hypothetical protein [Anatilimnocola aggregata]QDU26473.1 hypothetical protein ETAA8_15510 [Anatilimnocola aggregata]
MKYLPGFVVLCCILSLVAGCARPPAVQYDHLPLISSLRTACSARNPEWLAGVKRAVDQRHTEGKMTAVERDHFEVLIAQAEGGEWEAAERACLKFEQAQLGRTREPAEGAGHSHSHDH